MRIISISTFLEQVVQTLPLKTGPRRRVALHAVNLSTNNCSQALLHTRYASDSAGIFLGDRSLGPSFDSGILSLSRSLTHGEGSFPLYSSIIMAIYPPSIMDFWITHPPFPTGDPPRRRQQWHSTMIWRPWLASRARRSYTVRRLRVLTTQLDCSFFSRVLHHPLRRIHSSNVEAFTQSGLYQQAHLYHQYTFVPLLFHPLCIGVLPLL